MNILFIEYPKCSTCKKAKSWLIENKIEIMDRNIVEEVPTYDELKKWIELSGKPINKFFNTSRILYRQMEISKKLLNMTDDEKIKLLSSNGMLIKRPILVLDKNVLIGFKEKEWQDLFLIEKDSPTQKNIVVDSSGKNDKNCDSFNKKCDSSNKTVRSFTDF